MLSHYNQHAERLVFGSDEFEPNKIQILDIPVPEVNPDNVLTFEFNKIDVEEQELIKDAGFGFRYII